MTRFRTEAEILAEGLAYQRGGRLKEAEAAYQAVLAANPSSPDAHHLLAMTAHAAGQSGAALAHLAEAIRIRPDIAPFHNNLGHVLHFLGRPAEALLCYEQALCLQPDYLEALINLGNALQQLQRPREAATFYCRALELQPDSPEAHNNLGNALAAQGRSEEALGCFASAVRLRPRYAEAHLNWSSALKSLGRLQEAAERCRLALDAQPELAEACVNLGVILLAMERPAEAEAYCRQAIRWKPAQVEAHVALASALERQGRHEESEASARAALALGPGCAEAQNNLGNALQQQGRAVEAVSSYREAIRLKPELAEAHYNLGNALREQGELAGARGAYERALALDPGHVKSHWNLGLTLLLAGDFKRGWEEFEWRWRKQDTQPRRLPAPLWDGSPFPGRTVLLHAEQGLGDTIQFVRYAPLVKARGGTVVVELPERLRPLLAGCDGIDRLVAAGSALPNCDAHLPLLSLPGVFGTNLSNLPARVPYLVPAPAFREKWRRRLAPAAHRRIGLVWAGSPDHADDRKRSLTLDQFAPLAALPEVTWFALQYGQRACEAAISIPGLELTDLHEEIADFRDLAAAMLHLDLLVTVDTSAAHLAGALGVPVWLLLSFVPDWRWLTLRSDSPWYPTMRLFRQTQPGDWKAVIEEVREVLWQQLETPALSPVAPADMRSDGC